MVKIKYDFHDNWVESVDIFMEEILDKKEKEMARCFFFFFLYVKLGMHLVGKKGKKQCYMIFGYTLGVN